MNWNMLCVHLGTTLLSVERRAIPESNEIIPLNIFQYQSTNYEYRVVLDNWDDNINVFVVDNYLESQTLITEDQSYSFSVDPSIPASITEDRFSLVFDNTTLGVNDITFGSNFSLYPNPTSDGQFSIKTPNLPDKVNVEITNLLGQQVLSQKLVIEGSQLNINAPNLSTGIYVVKLSQNNQSFSSKLILE